MRTDQIDGAVTLYGIVGDPISAVRSPEFFNAWFQQHGINAVLVPIHVSAGDLGAAWQGLRSMRNVAGLVFTMPHKTAAAGLVDELGPTGQLVGAINTARREADGRWVGDMFDGRGFVRGLQDEGHGVAARRVGLLGTGGAGAAIALALAEAGVAELHLDDIDTARCERLAGALRARHPGTRVVMGSIAAAEPDIAVNATPLGMRADDPLPFDPARLPRQTLVVDVITKPEMTPLLCAAQAHGQAFHAGKHMHRGQALLAADFFEQGLRRA